MPIHEYRCEPCGERFERLEARADEDAPRCPHCGDTHVKRLLSVFAVARPDARPPGPCGSADCACRG